MALLLIKDKIWDVIKNERLQDVDAACIQKNDQTRATMGFLVEDNQLVQYTYGARNQRSKLGTHSRITTRRQSYQVRFFY